MTTKIIYSDRIEYRNSKNQLDRDDGPAIEWSEGDTIEEWYKNGKSHRLNGPTVSMRDGTKAYHKEGLLHNKKGPAVEDTEGNKAWWIEGRKFTKEDFNLFFLKESKRQYPNDCQPFFVVKIEPATCLSECS